MRSDLAGRVAPAVPDPDPIPPLDADVDPVPAVEPEPVPAAVPFAIFAELPATELAADLAFSTALGPVRTTVPV